MTSKKKKRAVMIFALLLLGLSIGYAYLNTTLNINGTSNIHNASWDVYWDNVQVSNESVSAETPEIDTDKTTVSFEVDLYKPGDSYEFTVDAKNDGSVDAMVVSVTTTMNDNPITNLPSYLDFSITYKDGSEIQNNQLLKSGKKETYKVKVSFKKDINASDLPSTLQNFSFKVLLNIQQANSDAVEVFHPGPASDYLVVNPDGVTDAEKSPYVNYTYMNGTDSNTILCRVLYDATSAYGLQIITDQSIENITLGTTNDDLGIDKYNNAILELNQKAGEYLDRTHASSARCVGSNPNSTETSSGPNNYFYNTGYYRGNGIYKDADDEYLPDYNQMQALEIIETEGSYWLASRDNNLQGSYRLKIRKMNLTMLDFHESTMSLSGNELVRLYSSSLNGEDEYRHYQETSGFRPVLKLKEGVKVIGGLGTKDNPYILGSD